MSIRRCIGVALLAVACSKKPSAEIVPYRITGRYDTRDSHGPRFSWPGTQIRARFSGPSVAIDVSDDGANELDWSVDGSAPVRLVPGKRRAMHPLASKLGPGEHELVITKRTEAAVGMMQLFGIDAKLVSTPAPPATARKIEMIGDSITAGYGVLGADASCPFSPGTEDASAAWGALAAKELNAIHTTIAWSGIGLYRNWDQTLTNTMPERYGRSLADDATSTWDASAFRPDVIVVALGTNDFAGAHADPGAPFQEKLVAFLTALRGLHPSAAIVLGTSPMLTGEEHAAQKRYFANAIAARGETKLTLLDVEPPPAGEGLGCDGHPNAATQRRMATQLVAHVRPILGW